MHVLIELANEAIKEIIEKKLKASLVLFALMQGVFLSGLGEQLEAALYQTSSAVAANVWPSPNHETKTETTPLTLLISSEMFEREFLSTSPLNRSRLNALLEQIEAMAPRVLAIDIDLSPMPNADPAQHQLNQTLHRIAQKTTLVLATPLLVRDSALQIQKTTWAADMCRHGAQIALPSIHTLNGTAIRYNPAEPTLGQVAARAWQPAKEGESSTSLCEVLLASKPETAAALLDSSAYSLMHGHDEHATKLLNANFFHPRFDESAVQISSESDLTTLKAQQHPVIFLGGGYTLSELYKTLGGERYGTVLHSSVFFSEVNPVEETPKLVELFIDVVFGAVCGYVFSLLWQPYYTAYARYKNQSSNSKRVSGDLTIALLWFLAVLFIGALFLWGMLAASIWMLQHGYQLLIAGLTIGMFVDSAVTGRHAEYAIGHHSTAESSTEGPSALSSQKSFLATLTPIMVSLAFIGLAMPLTLLSLVYCPWLLMAVIISLAVTLVIVLVPWLDTYLHLDKTVLGHMLRHELYEFFDYLYRWLLSVRQIFLSLAAFLKQDGLTELKQAWHCLVEVLYKATPVVLTIYSFIRE